MNVLDSYILQNAIQIYYPKTGGRISFQNTDFNVVVNRVKSELIEDIHWDNAIIAINGNILNEIEKEFLRSL